MPEEKNDEEMNVERMLEAALGGMTSHEALVQASRAQSADVEGRAAAIAKNRARALQLLAVLEKSKN